jgi:tetratricopeptide (TPR) repeat protein
MRDVAKLKKKAAELELKKQFDKALGVYVEILDSFTGSDEDVDVSLFNRVGDLYLKQGNVADAVDYYEQAVDRYADGGFFNNAIALCNKILRNSPGRASVYYKLGKISAKKGFKGDAKANFLEYADRMQQAGQIDEAFRALKEFADLCPDQDDIRLMLAEQLSKKERRPEAIEQLQLLYERYSHEGRELEARATIDRMKAIDPDAQPRQLGSAPRRAVDDLVFLDLTDGSQNARPAAAASRAMAGLEILDTGEQPAIAGSARSTPSSLAGVSPAPDPVLEPLEPAVLDAVTRVAEIERASEDDALGTAPEGFESTGYESPAAGNAAVPPADDLLDFEPTSFVSLDAHVEPADGFLDLEVPSAAAPERPSLAGLPLIDDDLDVERRDDSEDDATIGGDLQLIMPDEAGEPAAAQEYDDVPLLDFDLPMPGEAVAGITGSASGDVSELEMLDLGTTLGTDSAEADDALAPRALTPASLDDDFVTIPTPPMARRSATLMAEQSVELLQALVEDDPENNTLRRRLAEAMLESGHRDDGLHELENAMIGFERADDLDAASSLADEIVRLNPSSVRHHQKRVEYAFRTNERGRLIEAYLELANALFCAGQVEKSRAIYQRVLDLSPEDPRAQAALDNFPEPEREEETPEPAKGRAAAPAPREQSPEPAPFVSPATTSDDEFVNLGDWLRDDEAPKDTRMVVQEQEPTGDEEADFQDMLRKFKQGIAENVEEEDHQSHYDLGVAYKEMGLLDEAIAEFQKALRAPANRVPTYEALGQCFIEKQQYPMAATILSRALHEPGVSDDQLVGVLYLLGLCAEQRGQHEAALEYYQRVFVVDIQFRDIGDRLATVQGQVK